jgi:hypothetical protein
VRYHLTTIFMAVFVCAGCSAPSEPSGLSSSGVESPSTAKTNGDAVKTSSSAIDYGGALVGDVTMQSVVKKCLDTGKFYDRKAQKCTELALAAFSCRDDAVKTFMKPETKKQYEGLFSSSLSGYLLDQCLNCSSPSGNALCEGASTPKVSQPGTRLYLVKEDAGMLSIKTVYIPN